MEVIAQVLKADEPVSFTTRQGEEFYLRRLTLYAGGETISAEMKGALATSGAVFAGGSLYKVQLQFMMRKWSGNDGAEHYSNDCEIKRIAAM